MKRSGKVEPVEDQVIDVTEKKIWWKNGGGSFYAILDGKNKIIKPGERFQAYPREIPKAFLNSIHSVDPLPPKEPVVVSEPKFEAVPSETDSALFDVVNKNQGKAINGHPLEEKDALELAANLNRK